MDKVSIIVPIYNSESTLKKCLDSITNQTYQNIELLLINDGSKDESIDIIRKYSKKYKYIKIIDKKNEGVAKTRNLGIDKAKGKYIMFIDNDDYIEKDYVERFFKEIKLTKSDAVFGGYKREDSNGKLIENRVLKNEKWSKFIIMAPWAKMYNREFLMKNKIKFLSNPIGEDVYFNLSFISKNPKITIMNYVGYTWFYNTKSISNTKQKGMKKEIDILIFLEKLKKVSDINNKYIKYYFYKYCIWYLIFSGKETTSKNFKLNHKKYKEWLITNNCYKTIFPLSSKIKGELLRDRIAVLTFKILDKLHLVGIFAKIYCRGDKI